MNKNYTFDQAMASYRQRSQTMRVHLRRVASQRLVNKGFEEVGSSDCNHELYNMFLEYGGDWDMVFMAGVEEYAGLN